MYATIRMFSNFNSNCKCNFNKKFASICAGQNSKKAING